MAVPGVKSASQLLQRSFVSEPTVRGVRLCLMALALALGLVACGGGNDARSTATVPTRTAPSVVSVDAQPRAGLSPAARRAFVAGRGVVERSGCLACHRIGKSGRPGPGTDLSAIGATRGRTALRRALVSPTAPMPSFAKLPARDLDALVSFLSRLLPDVNGGLRCDRGTDCG
jgi:mono/diheme cytochrome c family protein